MLHSFILFLVFFLFALLAGLLIGFTSNWVITSFVVLAIGLILLYPIAFVYMKYEFDKKIGLSGFYLVTTVVVLILMSAGLGRDRAYFELKYRSNVYNIKLKGDQSGSDKTVLRIIDKGIIALDRKSEQIEFIPLRRISELKKAMPGVNP